VERLVCKYIRYMTIRFILELKAFAGNATAVRGAKSNNLSDDCDVHASR